MVIELSFFSCISKILGFLSIKEIEDVGSSKNVWLQQLQLKRFKIAISIDNLVSNTLC